MTTPHPTPASRVLAYLGRRAKMLSIDKEVINGIDGTDFELTVSDLQALAASAPVAPTQPASITLDFKQATELLDMYGGEPSEVTLMVGDGHSGKGVYAHWTEVPEEGAMFLGVSDYDATPEAAPVAPAPQPAAPEGYVLVPVEPTPAMGKAAADAWLDCGSRLVLNKAAAAVAAGIAAAPKAASLQPDWCELRRLHALAVADADRILAEWRAYKPAPLQQDEYLPLPEPAIKACYCYSTNQVREAIDADRAARGVAQAAPAPVAEDADQPHGFIKPDTGTHVYFYEQDFYVLSNFSAFTLYWDDVENMRFDTSEAAYHWEKFPGHDDIRAAIINAPSAHEAFKVAERNKAHRRPDWDDVKVDVMRRILRAKVEQHEYVRRKLLATGDRILVEDSWRDNVWGWGPNRDGQNLLGKLWMEVRDELRAQAAQPEGGAK